MPPADIDRVATTRRLREPAVMKQRWADLLFLHWPVAADALRPRLPPGLEVDTFEGRAYIAIVPFTVTGARAIWLPPLPLVSRFHEVNLRTYVRSAGTDPGVWFFTLDASNSLVVRLARLLYKLPYRHSRIGFTVEDPTGPSRPDRRRWVRFTARRQPSDPPELDVRYGPEGVPQPAAAGTLEHFLVERYVLYAYSGRSLYRARVHHAAYPLQSAVVSSLREGLVATEGLTRPEREPLAHYAREVRVEIFPLRRA